MRVTTATAASQKIIIIKSKFLFVKGMEIFKAQSL